MVLKGKAAKTLLGDAVTSDPVSFSTCRICLDEGEDAIMSKCKHVFCRECIRQYLETAVEQVPECPVCHVALTIDLNAEADAEVAQARQGMLERIDPGKWRTSTKIEALVEELSKLKTEDHSIKSLVFSQFTSFLDLIARRLQLAGFKIARLQGNMTPEARDRTCVHVLCAALLQRADPLFANTASSTS
jgi:DNA repair protein RAD16